MIATHVGSLEKHLEEQIAKLMENMKNACLKISWKISEITEKFKSIAALFKAPGE